MNGVPVRLERTPGSPRRAAPALGQDSERLLAEILGTSAEEIERLRREGVI